jgi:diguanylate cyclase (GGDEF)-like protein/PAS domain S-box-containing protein
MRLRSIRSRIVGAALATLVPCLLLVTTGLWTNYHNDREAATEHVLFRARFLAARLDDHLVTVDALLAGVARAVSPNPADADTNDQVLRQIKAELPSYVSNVQVFGLDGRNIGSSSGARRADLFAGDRSYFARILAGERMAIGDPVSARSDGRWVVTIARPLNDAEGRLRAVISVGTLLERLNDTLGLGELPPSNVAYVVNENGVLVSGRGNATMAIGATLSDGFYAHFQRPAREALEAFEWDDHVTRATGFVRTTRVPWVVAVGLPEDAVLLPVMSNLWWGIAVSVLAFLSALGLALAVTRLVVKPLAQLEGDAAILAGGNLSHRSSLTGENEIGRLACMLNQMAGSLERWQAETTAARDKAAAEAIERRAAEELERQAKETLAAVIDASPVAIVCSDPRRHIVVWSRAAEQIFGYTAAETLGRTTMLVPPEGAEGSNALFTRAFNGEDVRGEEHRRRRKNGSLVDVRVAVAPIYDRERRVCGVAWAYEDITDQKRAACELHSLAHFDQLTGLPNRVSLQEELRRLLAEQVCLSVALVDLDGFKHVNDTLGHSTGDRLLVDVGRRLRDLMQVLTQDLIQDLGGEQSRVFRLGGDEFVIVIPSGDPRCVEATIERALQALAAPFELNQHVVHLGGSVGVAIAPADGSDIDELLGNADLALYESKACGGGIRSFYRPLLRAQARRRHQLEQELRRAFERHEFELHFQPQVCLSDGSLIGAEALLRWRHPAQAIISPGAFIEALSENPIAPAMGRWIVVSACEKLAHWRRIGLPLGRVAVNLFPIQLNSATLVEEIADVLTQTGLPAGALELEITEKAALDHANAIGSLEQLFKKGVHITFDDFGTGYASLNSLTQCPLTRIKIDRGFVTHVAKNAEDAAIVRSLIVMAHNLGLMVLAEGVETQEQAAFLLQEGCDEAQGFLYAPALPAEEAYMRKARLTPADQPLPARAARPRQASGRMRQMPRRAKT